MPAADQDDEQLIALGPAAMLRRRPQSAAARPGIPHRHSGPRHPRRQCDRPADRGRQHKHQEVDGQDGRDTKATGTGGGTGGVGSGTLPLPTLLPTPTPSPTPTHTKTCLVHDVFDPTNCVVWL